MMGSVGEGGLGIDIQMKQWTRYNELSYPKKEWVDKILAHLPEDEWETKVTTDEDGFYIIWFRERS